MKCDEMQRPNCEHGKPSACSVPTWHARTMSVPTWMLAPCGWAMAQGSSWLKDQAGSMQIFSFSACVDNGFSPLRKYCTCLSQAASLLMLLTLCRYGCNNSQRFKIVFYSMVKTVVAAAYSTRRAGPTASMEDHQHAWMLAPCGWTMAQGSSWLKAVCLFKLRQ